jgi:hypothetical protein
MPVVICSRQAQSPTLEVTNCSDIKAKFKPVRKEPIMAAGAKPALDPNVGKPEETSEATQSKPATLKDRIIQKLTRIFEHNENLGVTRS